MALRCPDLVKQREKKEVLEAGKVRHPQKRKNAKKGRETADCCLSVCRWILGEYR